MTEADQMIVKMILEAREQFFARVGEPPRVVYLGWEEHKAFREFLQGEFRRGFFKAVPFQRTEYMGMEVLEVLKDSHLRVGF